MYDFAMSASDDDEVAGPTTGDLESETDDEADDEWIDPLAEKEEL